MTTQLDIAKVCYEANKALYEALGDYSQPNWSEAPAEVIARIAVDVSLHAHVDVGPEASHVAWFKMKDAEGWVYGPVKDAEKKQHPDLVPFCDLSPKVQAKYRLYRNITHALRVLL